MTGDALARRYAIDVDSWLNAPKHRVLSEMDSIKAQGPDVPGWNHSSSARLRADVCPEVAGLRVIQELALDLLDVFEAGIVCPVFWNDERLSRVPQGSQYVVMKFGSRFPEPMRVRLRLRVEWVLFDAGEWTLGRASAANPPRLRTGISGAGSVRGTTEACQLPRALRPPADRRSRAAQRQAPPRGAPRATEGLVQGHHP